LIGLLAVLATNGLEIASALHTPLDGLGEQGVL
jgi:hypothetical protein